MGKVVVMDHPLIQHKIGLMRRTETVATANDQWLALVIVES